MPRDSLAGATVNDPKRHFATINSCIAKSLFDYLVGNGEEPGRHGETKRLHSRKIDYKLELFRLHDWQIGGLNAL